VNAAEKLEKGIIANYNNQLQSNTIDLPAHVESLLQSLGSTTSDSGGKVTYYGSDPITPDRLPYGAISAISLAAQCANWQTPRRCPRWSLALAICTGIGDRPPSKNTIAMPSRERPFDGLIRDRMGERCLKAVTSAA
jgi:hypothetical protein